MRCLWATDPAAAIFTFCGRRLKETGQGILSSLDRARVWQSSRLPISRWTKAQVILVAAVAELIIEVPVRTLMVMSQARKISLKATRATGQVNQIISFAQMVWARLEYLYHWKFYSCFTHQKHCFMLLPQFVQQTTQMWHLAAFVRTIQGSMVVLSDFERSMLRKCLIALAGYHLR
jgi:hypothetical protein